ncbi:hypothetical protein BGY98DRAFT_1021429 [Russula aff. rugulosa BPL654]|nr:hypothetical protein BGY98DRAFT_1021429 [Russula aff. rugulosa BPL654]
MLSSNGLPPCLESHRHWLGYLYSQLDADHFGLDYVKRRLTEYLAVVRLRALIAQDAEIE